MSVKYKTGSLIVLAWPETLVVKPGSWYDLPAKLLGISKDNYYKAGHSAAILANHKTGSLHYFDFGRYHTPRQTGRVRDQITDPDLTINIKAIIDQEKIKNIEEILKEVSKNNATHGTGKMLASVYAEIDFTKVFLKAKELQGKEAIPYGPFIQNGTNCSRFVAQLARTCAKNWLTKILLRVPYTISATSLSNIRLVNSFTYFYLITGGRMVKKRCMLRQFRDLLFSFPQQKHNEYSISSIKQ